MGATRPASGIKAKAQTPNRGSQTPLITRLSVSLCLKNPDAGRVAPISGSVLCLRLVVAFSGSVLCLRLVVAFFQTSLMRHPISICAILWRRKVTKSGQKKDRINACCTCVYPVLPFIAIYISTKHRAVNHRACGSECAWVLQVQGVWPCSPHSQCTNLQRRIHCRHPQRPIYAYIYGRGTNGRG